MKIFLIGYMGSGKSTVGRILAEQLHMDFVDFDRYVEGEENKTITEIFDSLGEDKFREMEHKHLKGLLPRENVVVSLGGGTPCFYNNVDLINQNGVSVFLSMDVDTLVMRLSKAKNKRPLIRDLNDQELKYFIEANLEKRMAVYKQASIIINANQKTADELAEMIRKEIKA